MRFVGQTEIRSFLAQWPDRAEPVRAWVAEMKHREWANPGAIAADFLNVDASRPPVVVFYLMPANVRIDTLVDFRNGIVLLTAIGSPPMTAEDSHLTRNRHSGH